MLHNKSIVELTIIVNSQAEQIVRVLHKRDVLILLKNE